MYAAFNGAIVTHRKVNEEGVCDAVLPHFHATFPLTTIRFRLMLFAKLSNRYSTNGFQLPVLKFPHLIRNFDSIFFRFVRMPTVDQSF